MTWLVPKEDRVQTPYLAREVLPLEGIIIHGTVTPPLHADQLQSDEPRLRRWMAGRGAESSTHFVILRDGKLLQAADTEARTCHPGESTMMLPGGRRVDGLERCTLGVDLDNMGPLMETVSHNLLNDYGGVHSGRSCRRADQPHGDWFEPFTVAQIEALCLLLRDLCDMYPQLRDSRRVLAHHTVSPGRKTDPWAAFPWAYVHGSLQPEWVPECSEALLGCWGVAP